MLKISWYKNGRVINIIILFNVLQLQWIFLYLSILMLGGYGENKRIKARLSEEIVVLQRWEVKQENLLLSKSSREGSNYRHCEKIAVQCSAVQCRHFKQQLCNLLMVVIWSSSLVVSDQLDFHAISRHNCSVMRHLCEQLQRGFLGRVLMMCGNMMTGIGNIRFLKTVKRKPYKNGNMRKRFAELFVWLWN